MKGAVLHPRPPNRGRDPGSAVRSLAPSGLRARGSVGCVLVSRRVPPSPPSVQSPLPAHCLPPVARFAHTTPLSFLTPATSASTSTSPTALKCSEPLRRLKPPVRASARSPPAAVGEGLSP
ncbi:hypothetical protein CALCODRAFT_361062 [Calocera cornea HHB12733]|uniref:Uncharacterized protein n=1 Tax=Calocera cornea HHB12733 TaxID=1353952 RepID=A0A165EKX9_9BASI|nr:hypothetical protein CALCODRAFT_361062 [Calocera cornea HHB12733]